MAKSFLGKPIPKSKVHPHPKPSAFSWVVWVIAPAILLLSAGYVLLLQSEPSTPIKLYGESSLPSTKVYHVVSTPSATPTPSGAPPIVITTKNYCAPSYVKDTFNPQTIFPILPREILVDTRSRNEDGSPKDEQMCTPAYWNRYIVTVLIFKLLGFLYWFSVVLAIMLTIYGGLLYISGFANEGNVKKAKSIITAAYLGLAIVLASRLILYGTFQAITGQPVDATKIQPNNVDLP